MFEETIRIKLVADDEHLRQTMGKYAPTVGGGGSGGQGGGGGGSSGGGGRQGGGNTGGSGNGRNGRNSNGGGWHTGGSAGGARQQNTLLQAAHQLANGNFGGAFNTSVRGYGRTMMGRWGTGATGRALFGPVAGRSGLARVGQGVAIGAAGAVFLKGVGFFKDAVKHFAEAADTLAAGMVRADATKLGVSMINELNLGKAKAVLGASTMGGAAVGAAVGGVASVAGGGLGAVPGAAIGGMTGAAMATPQYAKAQLQSVIMEKLTLFLDELVANVGKYNAAIFGKTKEYEFQQSRFLFALGQGSQAMGVAWMNFKIKVLQYMESILPQLQPVFDALEQWIGTFADSLKDAVPSLLDFGASVVNAAAWITEAINYATSWGGKKGTPTTGAMYNTSTAMTQSAAAIRAANAGTAPWITTWMKGNTDQELRKHMLGKRADFKAAARAELEKRHPVGTGLDSMFSLSRANVMGMYTKQNLQQAWADRKAGWAQRAQDPNASAWLKGMYSRDGVSRWSDPDKRYYRDWSTHWKPKPAMSSPGIPSALVGAMTGQQSKATTQPATQPATQPTTMNQAAVAGLASGAPQKPTTQPATQPSGKPTVKPATPLKAPPAPDWPKIQQNIQLQMEMKLQHEKAVWDSMMQIRGELVKALQLQVNETRLMASLLDGKNVAALM